MSTLIQVIDVEKTYGNQEIFHSASAVINSGEKIGVIGRNGAGKSTLFKMIIGEEEPDSGRIKIHPDTRIGYLEQHDPYAPEDIVLEFFAILHWARILGMWKSRFSISVIRKRARISY